MLGRYRNSYAEINLQALEQNFLLLKKLAPMGALAPMVKADAYGHGDVPVAKICERLGARFLGVALIEEGIKLRLAGLQTPILYFGFFDSIGADAIVKYRLTPVLSEMGQIDKLKSALHESAAYPVHVKFNTGMQRLGFEPESASEVAKEFAVEDFLKLEGICTHLASLELAGEQEKLFTEIQKTIRAEVQSPLICHISNSSALLTGRENRCQLSRPGLSLYGVVPKLAQKANEDVVKNLRPVLSLQSQVALIHNVKKGVPVSYEGIWKADKPSKIAVVPLGYADGVPRALSNKGRVLIHGQYCPMVGAVCMDYFMVDVTSVDKDVHAADEVVLIGSQKGQHITAGEWAEKAGTISYEILTGIQSRVPRVYIH